MRLSHLSDELLLEETKSLAQQERELLPQVLHHLREIERRRLFSAKGYPSLFKYATDALGYSDDQAQRRISAMRLLKEMPEIEEKIESGDLTLSNISLAQSLFRQNQYSTEQKTEILEQLENKSARDAQKIVISISPKAHRVFDRIKPISEDTVAISFAADQALADKIEQLKGLLAHSNPGISLNDLMHKLCDLGLTNWNPLWTSKKRSVKERKVWQRDKGCCTNCKSTHALEVDHIIPRAVGGSDEIENLRLLCRSCNQRAAIEKLGIEKMGPYLNRDESA